MAQFDGRVIVGVKGTDYPDAALWLAADEARLRSRQLVILYAHVVPARGQGVGYVPDPSEFAREARGELDMVVERVRRRHPDLPVQGLLVLGRAHSVLVDESTQAGLLVLGSRMRGPTRSVLLGSVGAAVAAHAHCPVVVARGSSEHISRIVVGTDHSEQGRAAVRFAFEEAQQRDVPLQVVSTWEVPMVGGRLYWMVWQSMNELQEDAEKNLETEIAVERERFPEVQVNTVVEQAHPPSALLRQVNDSSLLVVGSRGHGGLSGLLLGSVSQAVLHHAHCAVAVVHYSERQ